jgi:hypothetical protein
LQALAEGGAIPSVQPEGAARRSREFAEVGNEPPAQVPAAEVSPVPVAPVARGGTSKAAPAIPAVGETPPKPELMPDYEKIASEQGIEAAAREHAKRNDLLLARSRGSFRRQ